MMTVKSSRDKEYTAWNPGIKSTLPSEYLPLSTMFRRENVFSSIESATELSEFTGQTVQQFVFFRPERLVVHELLIRVSADIFVSDGTSYEDLGNNFRAVVIRILSIYIQPEMEVISNRFEELEQQIRSMIDEELSSGFFAVARPAERPRTGLGLLRIFTSERNKKIKVPPEPVEQRDQRFISGWEEKAISSSEPLTMAVFKELANVARAVVVRHGRLVGDKALLTTIITGKVCNNFGSQFIGEMISPLVSRAAVEEGYTILPPQAEPVVINVKGASASGKSTMRPSQRTHIEKLGLNWHDFALISPDIWRKFLLDYDALGAACKYAGTLVGDEIPIVDQKLDRYIAEKARQNRISHLLIDRFRFDSFAPGKDSEEGSNLLTRFGHTVYLNFMVTPPEATVERAWLRGLQVGRFKAVDDLLDHNIEAFQGIPALFFTWALRKDKIVYYEFLDNSVPYGEQPVTIAFGLNGELNILNFKCMFDIERYTKINIQARCPAEVYPEKTDMASEHNADFLVQCARQIPKINFVDAGSSRIYACMESGTMTWVDPDIINRKLEDEAVRVAFQVMAPRFIESLSECRHESGPQLSAAMRCHLLGAMVK